MPDILTRYWHSLSASARDVRDRKRMREFERVRQACACTASNVDERAGDAASRTERLESIALYARAGYFNMGYTVDLFQASAELPSE
ncbi:hypothetical protein [Caballeronia insecticola]|uniref:Uncharacterized protein n=1 Tax=Caballeronia insecticola TaxID=758793 RepID=R4WSB4_9BURK|nr:hypothetical protein [Caballeronia insecticola]BAN27489.1 putative uncharacterized protein [Caballeronia insecticola]